MPETQSPTAYEHFAPFSKIDERSGEFEAWATLEERDASGEIIDLDKSFPYFEALANQFAKATDGVNFGPLREQHDPKKASGHLIAPPVLKTHPSGVRGVFIKGLPTDPGTKQKIIQRTLTGISIEGAYVGPMEDVVIDGRPTKKFVANPSAYAPVDSPCVKGALVTMIKMDGSEVRVPLRKEVAQFWDCNVTGCLAKHVKKDEARDCVGMFAKAAMCECCADSDLGCECESKDGGACSCHADCSACEGNDCGGVNAKGAAAADLLKIAADARASLSDDDFALPGRRYPIDTKARARNAIARIAQFGTASEQKKVRAKVKAKYPDIDVGGGDDATKSAKLAELRKSLWNVSGLTSALTTILCVINDEEYEEVWEALDAMRDGQEPDTAGMSLVVQLKQLAADMFDAIEALLAEERAEIDDDVYGELAMSAVASSLKKSATAKQLLKQINQSLRVRTSNGSIFKSTETTKEVPVSTATTETKKEEVKPATAAPETAAVAKAETSACNFPDDPTGHMHVGGVCKAEKIDPVAASVIKALSPKLDAINTQRAEKDADNDARIGKLMKGLDLLAAKVEAYGELPMTAPGALRATTAVSKSADAKPATDDAAAANTNTAASKPLVKYGETGVPQSIEIAKKIVSGGVQQIAIPVSESVNTVAA